VEYDPPETLCSIDVGDLHAPLFPVDREARVVWSFDQERELHSAAACDIMIDGDDPVHGDTLIYSGSTIREQERGIPEVYDRYRKRSGEDPKTVQGSGYEAEVWPGFAIAEIPCSAEYEDVVIAVGIVANYPEDPDENQAALAELIVPYADGVFAQVTVCDLSEGHSEPLPTYFTSR
jgi:hypothetical protein